MTCIAWDGRTLAADKLSSAQGLRRTVTKIHRINSSLVGASGRAALAETMFQWFRDGADPTKWPADNNVDDYIDLLVITPARKVLKYERTPHPIIHEDETFAMGSGRDFALAAMHFGKDARSAVEVACVFDTGCGCGIDTLIWSG